MEELLSGERRRRRRSLGAQGRTGKKSAGRNRRGFETEEHLALTEEIDFLQINNGPLFFRLGFFAVTNELAKFTGMFSVEGFYQGLGDRCFLGVADRHANPSDGLQERPVTADAEHQRTNHEPFREATCHNEKRLNGQ